MFASVPLNRMCPPRVSAAELASTVVLPEDPSQEGRDRPTDVSFQEKAGDASVPVEAYVTGGRGLSSPSMSRERGGASLTYRAARDRSPSP
eukprot:5842700-Pyramimonas_sp.AAC.1